MSSRSHTAILIGATLAGATALTLFAWSDPGESGPVVTTTDSRDNTAVVGATTQEAPATARREATPAVTRTRDGDPPADQTLPLFTIRGRVLDISGVPLAGVPVRTRADRSVLGESDGTGRFEVRIAVEGADTHLIAQGEGVSSVRQSLVLPSNREREHLLVATRAFDLGGTVVDASGAPLAGATVRVSLGEALLRDFPLPLDMARPTRFATVTDQHGRFALAAAPCPAGATIVARHDGYAAGQTPTPDHARQDLYIVLTAVAEGAVISGIVLRHNHLPAAGARVQYGFESTLADATGAFALALPSGTEADQPLAAGMDGHGLALVPRFGEQIIAARPQPPAPVTLVLSAERLDIAGRVVDASGEGRADWVVALINGTEISRFGTPPVLAENLGGGSASTATGEDGSFRLPNLLARDYELRAYDRKTLLAIFSGPVAAGTEGLELRVGSDLTYPRVRGKLLSRRGVPLAGVQITPRLTVHQTRWGSSWESGSAATTDQLGVFEFADFPRAHVYLNVQGESVVPQRFAITPDQDVENLTLTVAQRCHFRVKVQGSDLDGLAIQLRDREGKPLKIYSFSARMSSSSSTKALEQGRVAVSAVSEDAVELVVLSKDANEPVARQRITLSPEQVNELSVVLR